MPVNESLAHEQQVRYQYMRDKSHRAFIEKADKCDNFVIGNQWLSTDLNALAESGRPAITINKVLSTVNALLGEQINNRTEVLFRPSAGAPAEVADVLSKVWMQIGQNNQLPWVRSDVFADGIIRGRGFYDVRMDYSDSIFGEVRVSQLNSKNVIIDPDAEEYDPDKWSDCITTKWLTISDIEILFSKEDAEILKSRDGLSRYGNDSIDRFRDSFAGDQKGFYTRAEGDTETERNIRILDRQYRKLDTQKHFVDIATGDMRPVPEGWDRNRIASFLDKMGGEINVVKKLVKRIRWTVTADDLVLHDEWSPYKHFTVVPYFANFRYGKTVGVVENLLGPQEVLNKVSSQELHIVNATANSGYIVEEDSLVNMTTEELELDGAKTGLVIEYRKGTQPPVKIQPNQPPSGLDRISMKAEEHIKTISAVSDSMMGFDRADVAAKAIAYKRQQGTVGMSKVLDNLERTDWLLARNVLDLVQEFYTGERIINITHDNFANDQEQVVVNQMDPATGAVTNDLTLGEYDIVITSSPHRASLEDSQFEQARALRELGVPIPNNVLIENSRLLRRAEIVKTMDAMANSPQAQAQAALQMRALQAEVVLKEAQGQKTQANAEMLAAKGETEQVNTQKNVKELYAEEREGVDAKIALEKYRVDKTLELEKWKFEQELILKKEEQANQRAQALRAQTSNA